MLRNWALALRPTLSLDFLAGLNDSRITYSGGANGTRVNSAGLIVAATTPRFDYDPVTLAARGLLVEEARTNLLLRSAEFDNASWTKTRATITANATTAPDGTLTGDKIVSDATAANTHDIRQQVTVSDTTFALSIYFKAAECTWALIEVQNTAATSNRARAWFNLATGVVGAGNTAGAGVTYVSHSITNAGGGWYRCSLTCTTALTGLQVFIEPTTGDNITNWSGNSTDGAFVWGVQLEAGSFPTSYIPTTSASVTRTADSAVMTGTNFSSWYNQSEGTFVWAGDRNTAGGSTGVMFGCAETGVFNNSLYASNSSGGGSVIDIFYTTPGDPLWDDVAVVFNFQGPNGSTAATDGKGHAFSYIGGAVISTAVYAEGALQVVNGPTKQRVQADTDSPDFELAGDFCLEIDAYATTGNNTFYNVIFDTAGNGSGVGGFSFELSSTRSPGLVIAGSLRAGGAVDPNDGVKHRYCFDRSGSTIRFFRDGVEIGSSSYASGILSNGLSIGAFMDGVSTENWTGHIAAVRLTRASRYTANHTPPALPFPEANVAEANVGRSPANILNPFKLATSYAANDFAGTVDGQSPNTDASGTVPAPMQLLAIGSAPWAPTSAQWNGHIQSIAFYPSRLSNEQLQALTS